MCAKRAWLLVTYLDTILGDFDVHFVLKAPRALEVSFSVPAR